MKNMHFHLFLGYMATVTFQYFFAIIKKRLIWWINRFSKTNVIIMNETETQTEVV